MIPENQIICEILRERKYIMKTAINGKVRLKWFWRGMYSGKGMESVQRIFRLGKLTLAKVVYSKFEPFDEHYYREDVLFKLTHHYDVRWEKTPNKGQEWPVVYSKIDGGYVGTPENAYRFLQQGLTLIQKARPTHKVCSIGFNPCEHKWYGWSHRARYGFGIGDIVKEGDCCASSGYTEEYLKDHPEEDESLPVGFRAGTLKDARTMAVAFAESVS